MVKEKSLEDVYFPVPQNFGLMPASKPPVNQDVIKRIVQNTIRGAYRLQTPSSMDYYGNPIKPKAVASQEQVEMVIHLIEAIQPTDAIEAALASQFALTYIRGMEATIDQHSMSPERLLALFEFGHQVLETLQKYRSKGAQQISVQYNVNKGQVVNIKNEAQQSTIEGIAV